MRVSEPLTKLSFNTSRKWVSWLLLSLPAGYLVTLLTLGERIAAELLEPTGLLAALLITTALALGPLRELALLPKPVCRQLANWQRSYRRAIGVAGFGYALLHTLLYLSDMSKISWILAELEFSSIWSGWAALGLLVVPAAISSNWAVRRLGKHWKRLQRLVYPALALTLLHWWLIEHGFALPLITGAILSTLWLTRVR